MIADRMELSRAELFDLRSDAAGVIAEADGFFAGIAAAVGGCLRTMGKRWQDAKRFRRELEFVMTLDDRMIADMGFTRHDIEASRRARRWIRSADED